MKKELQIIGPAAHFEPASFPIFSEKVSAGFASPAEDYVEEALDLNQYCIAHPASTFLLKVQGDSMIQAGILPGDVLVVDRSLGADQGDIVIASLLGEFTVKELRLKPYLHLLPHNPQYQPIRVQDQDDFTIFGVVISVVRRLKKP